MKHLKVTHKVGDNYAAVIGGNVLVLDNGLYIVNSPSNFPGLTLEEVSKEESETRLISVPVDIYNKAGETSASLAEFEEVKRLAPNGYEVYDKEIDDEAGIPEMVVVPATSSVDGVLAYDAGEGYYALENGSLFRNIDGMLDEKISPASGSIKISQNLYNEALMSAESSRVVNKFGVQSVTD